MQHHAGKGPTLPFAPMGTMARGFLNAAMRMKRQPHEVVALGEFMFRYQLLVGMLRGEVPILRVKQHQHLDHRIN